MKLHERLRIARERKGYTQTHVAKRLGVSITRYNHWETGRATPSVEFFGQLADIYEVSMDYLKDGKPANATPKDEQDLDKILTESSSLMFSGVPMSEDDKETIRRLIRGYFWESLDKKDDDNK